MSIGDTWNRLEMLFRQKYPGNVDFLLPGATSEELQQLKVCFGPVPEDMQAVWSIHNGERWNGNAGVIPGFEVLNIKRIMEIQSALNEIAVIMSEEESNEFESEILPVEAGNFHVYSLKTLVFADNGAGDSLVLDFDPGPKGTMGQVTHVGPDEKTRYILAADLEAFLELLIWIHSDPRSTFVVSDNQGIEFNWLNGDDPPIDNLMTLRHILYREGKLYQPS